MFIPQDTWKASTTPTNITGEENEDNTAPEALSSPLEHGKHQQFQQTQY